MKAKSVFKSVEGREKIRTGNSEENRLNINSDEYPHWLNELLDMLNVEQAVIMGAMGTVMPFLLDVI